MSAMPVNLKDDSAKLAELSAIVQAVRDRVRARYPRAGRSAPERRRIRSMPVSRSRT